MSLWMRCGRVAVERLWEALWAETERVVTLQLSSQVVSRVVSRRFLCLLGQQISVTDWSNGGSGWIM